MATRPAAAQGITKSTSYTRVDADLLIPGRGDPIEYGSLVCGSDGSSNNEERGKILYAGPRDDLPSKYSSLTSTKVPVLMPGMWDCHVHYFGFTSLFLEEVSHDKWYEGSSAVTTRLMSHGVEIGALLPLLSCRKHWLTLLLMDPGRAHAAVACWHESSSGCSHDTECWLHIGS